MTWVKECYLLYLTIETYGYKECADRRGWISSMHIVYIIHIMYIPQICNRLMSIGVSTDISMEHWPLEDVFSHWKAVTFRHWIHKSHTHADECIPPLVPAQELKELPDLRRTSLCKQPGRPGGGCDKRDATNSCNPWVFLAPERWCTTWNHDVENIWC